MNFAQLVKNDIGSILEGNGDGDKPLTLEFGGETLPEDDSPDAQLSKDGGTAADIEALIPNKIKDLVDNAPSSIMFALSLLLGGSKLSVAMQSLQSSRGMRAFMFNVVLLLALKKDDDEVTQNLKKLLSAQSAKAAQDRLGKVYDALLANKETDKIDLNTLHGEMAKLIRGMPPVTLRDIELDGENNAQPGAGA